MTDSYYYFGPPTPKGGVRHETNKVLNILYINFEKVFKL
jgi:hypothetical protein